MPLATAVRHVATALRRPTARLGLAAALLGGALVPGALAPAAACACGGVISPGDAATAQQEAAALTWGGERGSVPPRRSLASAAEPAALAGPPPSPGPGYPR